MSATITFIIESGEDREEQATLDRAKLTAGEWQLGGDRIVTIEKRANGQPRRRWKATLLKGGDVRLDELFLDPFAPDALPPRKWRKRKRTAVVARIGAEQQRRGQRRARRVAAVGRPKKAVICLARPDRPPFASISAAAEAEGITRESMRRRLRTPGSGWIFAPAPAPAPATPAIGTGA